VADHLRYWLPTIHGRTDDAFIREKASVLSANSG
jgi:hypothetical protein